MTDIDLNAIKAERARLEAAVHHARAARPTSARGIHHAALICSDVEQTIKFYQGILEFPLTELFGNRDYKGSTHFFFDVGNGNLLAFFDFPGLDLGPYMETLGNINHIAISVTRGEVGRTCGASWTRPAWSTRWRAAPRSTSRARTASAWNSSPTPSARCTAPRSSSLRPPRTALGVPDLRISVEVLHDLEAPKTSWRCGVSRQRKISTLIAA